MVHNVIQIEDEEQLMILCEDHYDCRTCAAYLDEVCKQVRRNLLLKMGAAFDDGQFDGRDISRWIQQEMESTK